MSEVNSSKIYFVICKGVPTKYAIFVGTNSAGKCSAKYFGKIFKSFLSTKTSIFVDRLLFSRRN